MIIALPPIVEAIVLPQKKRIKIKTNQNLVMRKLAVMNLVVMNLVVMNLVRKNLVMKNLLVLKKQVKKIQSPQD